MNDYAWVWSDRDRVDGRIEGQNDFRRLPLVGHRPLHASRSQVSCFLSC